MTILRTIVQNNQRIQHTHDLFGIHFPLSLELLVYTFPELSQLTIPESVKQAILNHLLEPFQNEAEAKAYPYWEASGTRLVISEVPADSVPEYTEPLPEG